MVTHSVRPIPTIGIWVPRPGFRKEAGVRLRGSIWTQERAPVKWSSEATAGLFAQLNEKFVCKLTQPFRASPARTFMAHVVTSKCLGCKFTDCVEVCPVACFYELENQLIIHPDECIDCTACVAECPVQAIYAEADVPEEFQANTEFNATEAKRVKEAGQDAIVQKKDPLPTAEQRKAELGY